VKRVSSFFRYPGGKSKLRNEITQEITKNPICKYLEYREPFFGGGSIGLCLLDAFSCVWINDKDIGVSCLWTSVINYPEKLKSEVLGFVPSVDNFHKFRKDLVSTVKLPDIPEELVRVGFEKLAIHQISYSGLGTKSGGPLGGESQESKYKIDCRWSPEYICQKIDLLHAKLSNMRIHHNSCTNHDFEQVINNKHQMAMIYLDPPYYLKGNDLYQEGFTKQDHERLASLLKNSGHYWVLSYDDCPEIRALYDWAEIKTINVNYSITASKKKDTGERLSRVKPELIISKKGEEKWGLL